METEIKCFIAVNEQPETQPTYVGADCSMLVDDNDSGAFFGVRVPCTIIPFISSISLGSGGTGYTAGDVLTLVQEGGSGGTVLVNTVDENGVILTVTLLDEGTGYSVADGLAVTGGTGSDATINIDTISSVNTDIADACTNTTQAIRATVTVGGEDVSDSLVGSIRISHSLNQISTFSFSLGDKKYSPLIDANIAINAIVIITAYINGQTFQMFTGLVDDTKTTFSGGYRLTINGRDYGKKLLEKTMTLISVQEAGGRTRGKIVKYLAGQAGQNSVNIPTGDSVSIDHSFQDQSIWDMIQKECVIEGWYIRHDENAVMNVKTRSLKTTPDWEYGENKFIQLGLQTSDQGIINKVIILGAIFEEEVITINEIDVPPYEPVYDEQAHTYGESFSSGEVVDGWSDEDANFKVTAKYVGYTTQPGLPFNPHQDYRFTVTKLNNDLTTMDVEYTITGNAFTYRERFQFCELHRETFSIGGMNFQEGAFTITIAIKTKEQTDGGKEQYEEENPNEEVVSTITYTQVKATVTDSNSIALYGERKPNNEGTLEYPLAETEAQCKRIGENIILDSHRFIKQPDFQVPFNPKLIVGQTVKLTDQNIGYDEDNYMAEQVNHEISIDNDGKIKARTKFAGVYYA